MHRRPTPTVLKILRGNPGRRPLPENEPQPEAGIPDMPKHLNYVAKKEWKRISIELEKIGLLTKIDGTALAAYCDCYARWVEASKKLKKEGMLITGAKGIPVVNPLIRIANEALDRLKVFLLEFGMTPASRAKTKIAPKPDKKEETKYFEWVDNG